MHPPDSRLSSGNRKIQNIFVCEREREKFELTLRLSLKEELLLGRANIHLALFSIPSTAVATAYAVSSLLSLSLSSVYNEITQKKNKEDKNHNSSSNKEEKQ
jgi:hypothetical protein